MCSNVQQCAVIVNFHLDARCQCCRLAFGDYADKLAREQPMRVAALRKAQAARTAAELAFQELKDMAGTSTEMGFVGAIVEAETTVENARQAVKAMLVDGYELLAENNNEFEAVLSKMTQVWLVSGRHMLLPAAVIESLARAHNEEGLGLHIMGDNDPYFADANALLAKILEGTRARVVLCGN